MNEVNNKALTPSPIGNPAEPARAGYLLLFRGKDWDENRSPEELQELITEVLAWFDGVFKTGKVKGGQPLAREGRIVSSGGTISDGPFAESKEAIGGYLLLDVASLDEALAIARTCPTLEAGITIEVRPVLEECPVFARIGKSIKVLAA